MSIVGENLRAIRKQRGFGQVELARRAGLTQPSISELETGRRGAQTGTLERLAAALDVPISAFFQEGDEPSRVPPLPKTPLADSTPEAIEKRLYGRPAAEIKGDLRPVLSEAEARKLSDAARLERDALEEWIGAYATAPSSEKFERRADHERAQTLQARARFYHDLCFDYWTKVYDPRPVPLKSAKRFAAEQTEARQIFLAALENDAERQRIERSGRAG